MKFSRKRRELFRLASAALVGGRVGLGQQPTGVGSNDSKGNLQGRLFYSQHQALATALGDRLVRPGKERTTVTGVLTQKGVSTDLRLVKQLPSSFRLEEAKAGGRTIASFDGVAAKLPGGVTGGQPDEELGEALGLDTPETFLYSLADGLPYRFLGGRFRTDDGSTPDYKGPWVDI